MLTYWHMLIDMVTKLQNHNNNILKNFKIAAKTQPKKLNKTTKLYKPSNSTKNKVLGNIYN